MSEPTEASGLADAARGGRPSQTAVGPGRRRWIASVRMRIVLLAVIPVIGFFANGASFDLNERQVGKAFDNSAESRRLIEAGLELKGALATLLDTVREFSAQPSADLIEAFDKAYGIAENDIATLASHSAAEDRGLIGGLGDQLGALRTKFAALADEQTRFGLTNADGIRGRLQAAGAAIDRASTGAAGGLDDKSLMLSLLTLRRLDFEYRIARTGFIPQLFRGEIEHAAALLQRAGLPGDDRDELAGALAEYGEAFEGWMRNAATVAPLFSAIKSDIQLMLPQASELVGAARERAARAAIAQQDSQALARSMVMGIGIATAGIGLLLSWLIGRSISTPLQRLTEAMEHLAGGRTDIEIPGTALKSEIGSMARTVEVFKRNAEEMRELTAQQLEARKKLNAERRQLLVEAAHRFEDSVAHLLDEASHATGRVETCVGDMKTRIDDVARHADSVRSATGQTLSSARAVSSAIDDMTRSVEQISQRTTQSANFCANTSTAANEACAAIENLAEQCLEISSIVNVIRQIAEQTNLLALNATIEAARAGDSGRGFAVVAEEVKNLAGQTAEEIEGIESKIESIQSATASSVETVKHISGLAVKSREATAEIAVAVERQTATARQISSNVGEAGKTTQAVADILDLVTGDVSAAERATGDVLADVGLLKQKFDLLVRQIKEFLTSMKEAELDRLAG